MKRSGFKRPEYKPAPAVPLLGRHQPKPRAPAAALRIDDGKARMVVPVPKEDPARHEGYRRLVAAMPCARCRIDGFSQAAHPNTGKGMALKTDDRLCFPLCGPRYGEIGCHARLDSCALFNKATRRDVEARWSNETAQRIFESGSWPSELPLLEWMNES